MPSGAPWTCRSCPGGSTATPSSCLLGKRWRPATVISFGRPPDPDCLTALEQAARLTAAALSTSDSERCSAWRGGRRPSAAASVPARSAISAAASRAPLQAGSRAARRRRPGPHPPAAAGAPAPRPAGRSRATRTQTAWPRRSAHSARTSCASIIGFSFGTRMAGQADAQDLVERVVAAGADREVERAQIARDREVAQAPDVRPAAPARLSPISQSMKTSWTSARRPASPARSGRPAGSRNCCGHRAGRSPPARSGSSPSSARAAARPSSSAGS